MFNTKIYMPEARKRALELSKQVKESPDFDILNSAQQAQSYLLIALVSAVVYAGDAILQLKDVD